VRGWCSLGCPVQIELCKKSLERLTSDLAPLLSALRDREHSPLVKDCLNRCQRCDLGFVMATADGVPMSAPTLDQLLDDLDALAADDL
jgi:hypothetical protein